MRGFVGYTLLVVLFTGCAQQHSTVTGRTNADSVPTAQPAVASRTEEEEPAVTRADVPGTQPESQSQTGEAGRAGHDVPGQLATRTRHDYQGRNQRSSRSKRDQSFAGQ